MKADRRLEKDLQSETESFPPSEAAQRSRRLGSNAAQSEMTGLASESKPHAMDEYTSKEVIERTKLWNTPSGKTYLVNGKEAVCVDEHKLSLSNAWQIRNAPLGALEAFLLQERDDLHTLVQEASEVQKFVKSVIFPDSAWQIRRTQDPLGTSGGKVANSATRLWTQECRHLIGSAGGPHGV